MKRRRSCKTTYGFTLFEVIIVASIFMLLSTAGISCLNSCREYTLLRMSAQAFSGELNRARATSIACGIPVEIRLGQNRKSYNFRLRHTNTDFAESSLPGILEFSSSPSKSVVFYNSGTCAPSGSYVIRGKKASVKVVVSIMGRVRWEFL